MKIESMSRIKILFGWGLLVFILGQLVGFISFKFFHFDINDNNYRIPSYYPPAWLFISIWTVLYWCMGISAGHLWLLHKKANSKVGVAAFFIMLSSNFMFVPVMNLSKGNPAILTLMDLNALISTILYSWLCLQYSRKAFNWSLALTIWVPITFSIKIGFWILNADVIR